LTTNDYAPSGTWPSTLFKSNDLADSWMPDSYVPYSTYSINPNNLQYRLSANNYSAFETLPCLQLPSFTVTPPSPTPTSNAPTPTETLPPTQSLIPPSPTQVMPSPTPTTPPSTTPVSRPPNCLGEAEFTTDGVHWQNSTGDWDTTVKSWG